MQKGMDMRELEYPFDADLILSKKKSLKRRLLEESGSFTEKRIAILGGGTTSDIKQILELFLLNYGIAAEFYESEYNAFYRDAVFDNEELLKFKPDIIYVCTSNRNIDTYPSLNDDSDTVDMLLKRETDKYMSVWRSLKERYNCPIIQNNFEMPYYRLLGNRDAYDIHGRVNFLSRLNANLYEYAREHEDFHICDINYISADYGLKEWSDPFYWHMYKYALNVNAIPYLSFNVANIIKSIFGKNKKGFVLDLDNTLWGGVIGDDGAENIVIGPEESEGQAYTEFQQYIKAHGDLGIILNIDSKNDEDNALSGLDHPDSVLKKDDFIMIKANWDPKDKNFKEIADTLNLLPESLVFVDDNPAERHIVRSSFGNVSAPEIETGDISHFVTAIDRAGYFEVTSISEDDKKRKKMYKDNAKRAQEAASFTDYHEYLLSLSMKADIKAFEPVYMARISQLTNKSNQFNLTTKRMTQDEIEKVSEDDEYITLYGKLTDKFGDNGVVSVVIGHIIKDALDIELWLMSCRVLKRDMEYAMLDTLVKRAKERGIDKLLGHYYPTAKNAMVKDFYDTLGFKKIKEEPDMSTSWELYIKDYKDKNTVICVEE